jgi:CrcB protein
LVLSLSFSSYMIGQQVSPLLDQNLDYPMIDDSIFIFVPGVLGITGSIVWASFNVHTQIPLSLLFSIAGSFVRFFLSKFNCNFPNFALGTFLANILAVVILSILTILNHAEIPSIACTWIYALQYGFCGCLSTVSTFIVELANLKLIHAYQYSSSSISIGILATFIIVGSYQLSNHSISSCF